MGIPILKEKRKNAAGAVCILVITLAVIKIFEGSREVDGTISSDVISEVSAPWRFAGETIKEHVLSLCTPVFSFVMKDNTCDYENYFEEALLAEVPFFSYSYEESMGDLPMQDETTWQKLLAENEVKAGNVANQDDATDLNEADLNMAGSVSVNETAGGWEEQKAEDVEEAMTLAEAFLMENENAKVLQPDDYLYEFIPHERQRIFNMDDYGEFSDLFKTFYAMDSNTMIGKEQLNVDTLLEPNVTIDKTAPGPQILIYHTHSQESYADSVPGDKSTSVIGAGDKLTKLLTENYGYSVLHHTGEYDVEDRDSAYSRSLPALEKILEENPSIQVIIDLHRDGVAADRKLAIDLDGRPTAQFMFFNGLSRTKNTGDIDYLYNPYQSDNLALSFQMQLAADEYYPGLARRIYLNGYRYNMHLRPSLLIELGAQTNTVEEIMNAVDPLAHVLDLVFSGKNQR